MPDDNDFDRRAEREEDREESRFAAKLTVEDFNKINMQRCCVFIKDFSDNGGEVIHGRLMGMMAELDALVIRDLRLGREALQTKQIVPYENVHHLCASASLEKCEGCAEYVEMREEALRETQRLARERHQLDKILRKANAPAKTKRKKVRDHAKGE